MLPWLLVIGLLVFLVVIFDRPQSSAPATSDDPLEEEAVSVTREGGGPVEKAPQSVVQKLFIPDVEIREDLSESFLFDYGNSQVDPRNDVEQVFEVLDSFNSILKGRTELSRLGNRQLTRALLGENNDGVRFLSPESPALNANGELVDRWDNPYVFHFQDAFMPEVRSAGPDQKMWTEDDLLMRP